MSISTCIHRITHIGADSPSGVSDEGTLRLRLYFRDNAHAPKEWAADLDFALFADDRATGEKFARLAAAITEIFADEPAKQEAA